MINKLLNIVLSVLVGILLLWKPKQKLEEDKEELEKVAKLKRANRKELTKLLLLTGCMLVFTACTHPTSQYCTIDYAIKLEDPWLLTEEDQLTLADHNKMYYCLCDKNKSKELDCYK